MTDTTLTTGDEGGSVDRRWFEEALRSQGFVVEPPDAETSSPVADVAKEDPGPAMPVAAAVSTASPDERPPVPSALLARIASRGQGPSAVAPSEPDASRIADQAAEGVIGTAAASGGGAIPPWEIAVPAVVAPWSATAEPAATEPAATEPAATEPAATEPAATEPAATEHMATEQTPAMERLQVATMTPPLEPVSPPVVGPTMGSTAVAPAPQAAVDTAALLESPYAPAPAPTEVPPLEPSPVRSVSPEADEGGLWALVGSPEPAAATPRRSEAVRVVLTILTAIAIIVIVVGSLVLASQLV